MSLNYFFFWLFKYTCKDNLDVKLLKATPNDLGWDIFSLTYNAEMPITTILSQ